MLANTTLYIFLISLCLISAINADPQDQDSKEMVKEFLEAHNAIRIRSGVPPLKWDKEVSRYAHHHLNQLIKTCTMVHSVNSPYGENLFLAQDPQMGKPTDIVNSWAGQAASFDRTTLTCSLGPTGCDQYKQIVWYDTKLVGCKMLPCAVQPGAIAVCSYDPPGNFSNGDPLVSHVPGLPLPPP